ncbi:MAG: exodeoxyribonuclease VII small subunit [Clostridia bacterium]|nr:exodeoxyribonuclease VII small subunit [Clostridia bacterium]
MKFEEALKELETIVSQLESGEKTLDESIALFEKGITLSKTCNKMIDEAEQKVRVLINDEGAEEDFKPMA